MDATTIFVTVAVMVLANGAVLSNIQRDLHDVLRPSALRWQIATLLVAIGSGAFAFGGTLPVPVMVTIANAALVGGLTFYHWSIQRLYGEEPSSFEAVISALLVATVYWFSAMMPNFTVRLSFVAVFWIIILGRSAWTLHRYRAIDPSRSRRMLLIIYLVLLASVMIRAALYICQGLPLVFTVASSDSAINLASPVVMALLPVVGTTTFTLMCVDRMRQELLVAASTDYLTGLANRRTLDRRGEELVEQVRATGRGFAVAVLDLDDFKGINDTYGHSVGDAILVQAAEHLHRGARKDDAVVRSGGEEFVLLLADTDQVQALAIVEGIRASIAENPFYVDLLQIPVTVSAGIAVYREGDEKFDSILQRSDRALYRAKAAGRNRVEMQE